MAAPPAAAPVIGGIYDNTMDEHYMSLLLEDPESTAEMYFTSDQVYLDYCSEMNAWVSPLATREEYLNSKRGLESLTADLPDISKAVQFLVTTYRGGIDNLLVNYECILNDTKSAKYDFAFYYMINSFLEIVEKEAALLAVLQGRGQSPPRGAATGQQYRSPDATASLVSADSQGGSTGGSTDVSLFSSPSRAARNDAERAAARNDAERAAARTATTIAAAALAAVPAKPAAAAALAAVPAEPAAAAAGGGGYGSGYRSGNGSGEEGGSGGGGSGGGSVVADLPASTNPNLPVSEIKNLQIYLKNLYQGPHDLIFNEEITQFHIALLIKYMHN